MASKSPNRAEALMLAFGGHPYFASLHRQSEQDSEPEGNALIEHYNQYAEELIAEATRPKRRLG